MKVTSDGTVKEDRLYMLEFVMLCLYKIIALFLQIQEVNFTSSGSVDPDFAHGIRGHESPDKLVLVDVKIELGLDIFRVLAKIIGSEGLLVVSIGVL